MRWRRDSEANWLSVNPVLLLGEVGLVTAAGGSSNAWRYKIGDGVTAWADLSFHDAQLPLASDGAIGSSGLTQATNRLLGRGSSGIGAIEEITLGSNLSLSGTTLNAAVGSMAWSSITDKPITLSGFGITDAAPSSHLGAGGTAHANAVASGAAGFLSGADKAKLDGISSGATANATDAQLRDRSTHTGTQAASTISDFNAASRAQTEAALVAGTNITITPGGSGATRTLTIASTATGGGGIDAIHIDASEFIPSTTSGCGIDSQETATNRVNRDLLTFDPGTRENAIAWFTWPTGWATAKVTVFWTTGSGSGSVVFGAEMRIFCDNDSTDSAWGTAQEVTDASSAGTHRQTAATAAITPGGVVTAGCRTAVRLYRNATSGSDDLAVDALVTGVLVEKAS